MTFLEKDRTQGQSIDRPGRSIQLDDPTHDYYYMPSKRRSKRSFDEQDDDDDDAVQSPFLEAPTLFKMAIYNNS